MEKEVGRTIVNMFRRGDSSVREEACRCIQRMSAKSEYRRFFVRDLDCVPSLVNMIRSGNQAEQERRARRDRGLKKAARTQMGGAPESEEGGGRPAEDGGDEDISSESETAFATTHKLIAMNLVAQIMKDDKAGEMKLALGRCGLIPDLVAILHGLVMSHGEVFPGKNRVRLLERAAKG